MDGIPLYRLESVMRRHGEECWGPWGGYLIHKKLEKMETRKELLFNLRSFDTAEGFWEHPSEEPSRWVPNFKMEEMEK